jgi:hypothetical protein
MRHEEGLSSVLISYGVCTPGSYKWSVYDMFSTKPTYALFSVPLPATSPVLALRYITALTLLCTDC